MTARRQAADADGDAHDAHIAEVTDILAGVGPNPGAEPGVAPGPGTGTDTGLDSGTGRGEGARTSSGTGRSVGVSVTLCPRGPLLVRGADVVRDESGREFEVTRPVVAICRCGKTSRAPWCDGTHKVIPTTAG